MQKCPLDLCNRIYWVIVEGIDYWVDTCVLCVRNKEEEVCLNIMPKEEVFIPPISFSDNPLLLI